MLVMVKKPETSPKCILKMERPAGKEKKPPSFIVLYNQTIIGEQTLSVAHCHWGLWFSNKKSMRELDAASMVFWLI